MPDDPTPDPAPTPDPKPDEPTPTPTPEPTPAPDPKPDAPTGAGELMLDGKPFDPKRAMDTIYSQRESERRLRDELREAREKAAKYDELEREKLSREEQAELRANEAETKATNAERTLRKANLVAALTDPSLSIVNARAAAKLIEGVEYDDDGEPTNLGMPDDPSSLIAKFLAENDYLRGKPASKPTPPPVNAREGGDKKAPELKAEELEAARRAGMTPEEYQAFKNGGSLADLQAAGLDLSKQT